MLHFQVSKRAKKAYTMIELVVVMAIIAIITSIAVVKIFSGNQSYAGDDFTAQATINSAITAELNSPGNAGLSPAGLAQALPAETIVSGVSTSATTLSFSLNGAVAQFAVLSKSGVCWVALTNLTATSYSTTTYGKILNNTSTSCTSSAAASLVQKTTENTWSTAETI